MKNLLLIFFLLTSLIAKAQDGFEYAIKGGDRQRMQGAGELANGDYVVSNLRSSASWDELSVSLSLLDGSGELKDIVDVEYKDYMLAPAGVLVASDSSFFLLGIAKDPNNNVSRIWIGEFMNDLTLIDAHLYGPNNIDYKHMVGHLESDSTLLVTGWAFVPSAVPFAGRIDFVNDYSKVHLNTELSSSFGCFDIIKRIDSVGYMSMGYFDYYLLDEKFKVVSVVDKTNNFFLRGYGDFIKYTDSTYLMTGETRFPGTTVDVEINAILVGEIRASDLSLKRIELFATKHEPVNGEEIHNQPAGYSSIAKSKASDDIFFGGTYDFDEHLNMDYDNKFALAKYNANLDKLWEKKYGDHSTYYEMYGVVSTSDGGCLMYGYRVQYSKGYPLEAYVLKVNEDGIITGETVIPMQGGIACYPNPAKDYIQFDLPKAADRVSLVLIGLSGSVVLSQKITHQVPVDISFLPQGMYMYQVKGQDDKLMDVGKLLKE